MEISMDRFSNLPDHVSHRILFFLSMEDFSKLSVASKRCRQLCISTPFLTFDLKPYTCNKRRGRLMEYVDRFLFLRKGMDVQHCHIRWNPQISEEFRVLSWLHNALTCNVKHLVLEFGFISNIAGLYLKLPSSLLCSTSLERLQVSSSKGSTAILMTPSTGSPSSLKHLILKSVRIDESFGDWISSNCKLLKKLQLEHVRGATRIIITSASLEELNILSYADLLHLHVSAETLRVMSLHWRFDSPIQRALRLSTPKLKELNWTGNISSLLVEENLEDLVAPKILLMPFSGIISDDWTLSHVIQAVCNNKLLGLDDHYIQELLKLGCLPVLFPDLLALRIWINCNTSVNLMPSLTCFLKGTPNLKLLLIGRKRIPSHTIKPSDQRGGIRSKGSRETQDTPLMYNLKIVVIELISQYNNELELIKYFLKNATNLKKMTLLFSGNLQSDFTSKINRYKKASSDVMVNFESI